MIRGTRPYLSVLASALALGGAAQLLGPAQESLGFDTIPGHLQLGRRHVRVYNNFADSTANDNQAPDPMFPGWQGADMALWKASVEWGSTLHGDGSGTPGHLLGEGGANFDFSWAGRPAGVGNSNHNIVSVTSNCNPGVLAFVELPIHNGWRMKFCEQFTWEDGPGNAQFGRFSIQGVGTHEFGHALGLGHSNPPAVMKPSTGSGNETRNLDIDDKNGVQFKYGVKDPTKPEITGISVVCTNVITVTGTNFSPKNNEVWFTNKNVTGTSQNPRVRVQGLKSGSGGTQISVGIPPDAGPGDVLVLRDGLEFSDLSNAWPFDPAAAAGGVDGVAALQNGSGTNSVCFASLSAPNIGEEWLTQVTLKPGDVKSLLAVSLSGTCHAGGLTPGLFQGTELLALGPYVEPHDITDTGLHSILVPADCALVGASFCTQAFGVRLGPLRLFGFNALDITVGDG